MAISCLINLSEQRQLVAELIIEVVIGRYPQDIYDFTFQDLYDRKGRIQTDSNAADIKASIRSIVYYLRNEHNLLEDTQTRGRFRLVEDELLYWHVKLRRVERVLERTKQEIEEFTRMLG
jgi:hypothetical protein